MSLYLASLLLAVYVRFGNAEESDESSICLPTWSPCAFDSMCCSGYCKSGFPAPRCASRREKAQDELDCSSDTDCRCHPGLTPICSDDGQCDCINQQIELNETDSFDDINVRDIRDMGDMVGILNTPQCIKMYSLDTTKQFWLGEGRRVEDRCKTEWNIGFVPSNVEYADCRRDFCFTIQSKKSGKYLSPIIGETLSGPVRDVLIWRVNVLSDGKRLLINDRRDTESQYAGNSLLCTDILPRDTGLLWKRNSDEGDRNNRFCQWEFDDPRKTKNDLLLLRTNSQFLSTLSAEEQESSYTYPVIVSIAIAPCLWSCDGNLKVVEPAGSNRLPGAKGEFWVEYKTGFSTGALAQVVGTLICKIRLSSSHTNFKLTVITVGIGEVHVALDIDRCYLDSAVSPGIGFGFGAEGNGRWY